MTHEEIEAALMTTGAVDIDAGEEGPIVLSMPNGRRLAEVVFAQLRSSNVDDLAKNTVFFGALEAEYCNSPDEKEPDVGTRGRRARRMRFRNREIGGLRRSRPKGSAV